MPGGRRRRLRLAISRRYLIPLIKDGVLDQPSMDGRTPLWTAARNGHAAVCEVLVEQKASAPGAPPPIMFERVIPAGRNRDLFTGGTTALQAARNQRHTRVCEILEGATASQRSGKVGRRALLRSASAARASTNGRAHESREAKRASLEIDARFAHQQQIDYLLTAAT